MFKTLIAWAVARAEKLADQRFARRFNAGHMDALLQLDKHIQAGANEAEAVDMVISRAFQADAGYYKGARFAVRGWQARRVVARNERRVLEAYERKHQEQNRT